MFPGDSLTSIPLLSIASSVLPHVWPRVLHGTITTINVATMDRDECVYGKIRGETWADLLPNDLKIP